MSYANLKTFTTATVKPYITALQTLYQGYTKTMMNHVVVQEQSITSLQAQVAKLSNLVVSYEAEILKYSDELADIKKNTFSSQQVAELARRNRELEMICLELYTLVKTKFPDAELPDFNDTILPDDPIPTASDLESTWRTDMGITADSELDQSQSEMLRDYIVKYYNAYPYPPTYPVNPEPNTYWTDDELRAQWLKDNNITDSSQLTDEQEHAMQAYLDFYDYTIRVETSEPSGDDTQLENPSSGTATL